MKPLGIIIIAALIAPVNAWDDYRDSNNNRRMPEYTRASFVRPLPHSITVPVSRPEIPKIDAIAPLQFEKPSNSYLKTFADAIKAPFMGIGAVVKVVFNLPVIKSIQEGFRIAVGYTLGIITGDTFRKSNPVQFDRHGPAVISVNGVRNTQREAREINNYAMFVAGVEKSTMIKNESFLLGIGDLIQSFKYEYLNALDKPVMDTYKAIQQGIEERGYVMVFAHSQGTAVAQQAKSLLTKQERELVKFVGVGNERNFSGPDAINIHNPRDPIPWINHIKIITNMIFPWNWGRDTAPSIIGEGRGHSFKEYESSIEKALENERRNNPWEKYLRP